MAQLTQILPNFVMVEFGGVDIYFSYRTPIAFRKDGRLVIRENDWTKTTGKHLNLISEDKSIRISGDTFLSFLKDAEGGNR